jgi:hypothetical protein
MKIDSTIQQHQGWAMSRLDINAVMGIFGIYALGAFLIWYPLYVLKIP